MQQFHGNPGPGLRDWTVSFRIARCCFQQDQSTGLVDRVIQQNQWLSGRMERVMSLDSSLRIKGNLTGKRNVLTRAERIAKLRGKKQFDPKRDPALGLVKTRTD